MTDVLINEIKNGEDCGVVQHVPFEKYDAGWVILCIGMAIGGGIGFLPIQIGLKGIWVFSLSLLLAYPAVYFFQDLYLKTLSESPQSEDYASIISHYLGRNWGAFLGVVYFIMLLQGLLMYCLSITFDSASYLRSFGITDQLLSDYFLYGILLLGGLVAIAAQGERLIFRISGPMIIIKLAILLLIGFAMLPYWNLSNIDAIPSVSVLIRDAILTMPYAIYSILFLMLLSPMNSAFNKVESNRARAKYRTVRASRIAYAILTVSVLFYAFSFTLTLSHADAVDAYINNISALALTAKIIPGNIVKALSIILNFCAVLTAFFGMYLAYDEAFKGIFRNVAARLIDGRSIEKLPLTMLTGSVAVLFVSGWSALHIKTLILAQIGAPLFAIVSCLLPCYLVYHIPALHKFKGWRVYFIVFIGIILCVTPFLKIFE